jgi:hypothetical protein
MPSSSSLNTDQPSSVCFRGPVPRESAKPSSSFFEGLEDLGLALDVARVSFTFAEDDEPEAVGTTEGSRTVSGTRFFGGEGSAASIASAAASSRFRFFAFFFFSEEVTTGVDVDAAGVEDDANGAVDTFRFPLEAKMSSIAEGAMREKNGRRERDVRATFLPFRLAFSPLPTKHRSESNSSHDMPGSRGFSQRKMSVICESPSCAPKMFRGAATAAAGSYKISGPKIARLPLVGSFVPCDCSLH